MQCIIPYLKVRGGIFILQIEYPPNGTKMIWSVTNTQYQQGFSFIEAWVLTGRPTNQKFSLPKNQMYPISPLTLPSPNATQYLSLRHFHFLLDLPFFTFQIWVFLHFILNYFPYFQKTFTKWRDFPLFIIFILIILICSI